MGYSEGHGLSILGLDQALDENDLQRFREERVRKDQERRRSEQLEGLGLTGEFPFQSREKGELPH